MRLPRHSTVVAYLALFIALGGSAYAVTSSTPTGVLRACVSNQTGAMRLLRQGSCKPSERLVTWNVAGPAGPAGAQGSQGPQGVQGPTGPTGTVETGNFYTKTESDSRYLPIDGTAADSSDLGGVAASGYLTTEGTAANSSELGGVAASGYLTTTGTAANSSELGGVAASGYLTSTGTAANSSELGGSPASAFEPSGNFGDSSLSFGQGNQTGATCTVGEVVLDAGVVYANNWLPADGRVIPIAGNTALFSLVGITYGGNGTTNFGLPNLSYLDPRSQGNGSAAPQYIICVSGTFPGES
jgi:acyl dehydratase